MPELVEVECWRLVLEQYCQGLRIKHCEFADDAIVLGHADPRELVQGVSGHSVMSLSRKGKHLWMNLENKKMLCFHFGMTGQFFVRKKEGEDHQIHGKIQLKSNIRHSTEMQWPPKYWKCRLVMEDGTEAVFLNVRRLGRIRLLSQSVLGDFIQGLGFDPYIDNDLSDQEFLEKIRLAGHRPIKAVLLDQSVIAGVGNWISDEVLYQTGIHPKTTSTSIEIQDASAILRTLKTIICEGIDRVSRGDELPPEWLFHYRFTRKHTQDYYGNTIKFDTIGGRSAAYVPKIQKRIDLARQTERIPEKKTGTRSMKRARVLRDLPSLESS